MAERESEVSASSFSSDLEGFVAGGFPKTHPRALAYSPPGVSPGELSLTALPLGKVRE